jgi:hypothetical protein
MSATGSKTVNLTACPPGVKGNEPEYWVYISGRDTGEAVKVTGGSCAGDGRPGTLQFATARSHASGYTIKSASDGLQEALIAARFIPTNPAGKPQAGKVIVPPGEYQAYARVSIRSANMTVDFSGSIVECHMDDSCIYVGDPKNSSLYENITIINPRGRPMVANGTKPFIEVNAQKTRVINVGTRAGLASDSFGTYVQVDDDQGFLLDGLDSTLGYGIRCDASFCGSYVTAPGPFNTWSAVGWLKNMVISAQCKGNGVDWQSGNTVHVSDSVIQGWSQFGLRGGVRRGGGGGTQFHNVYTEASPHCHNPLGNVGQAGVIQQGKSFGADAAPAGIIPLFAKTGSTDYRYYVVARHKTFGVSNPLYAGKALTNGSGNVTVTTPDIAGASTFDLLRVTTAAGNVREQAPFGTGNYAVATNVSRDSACAKGVCTFTDTQAAPSTYTVPAVTYFPLLDYWPGGLILSAGGDTSSYLQGATAGLNAVVATNNIVSVRGSRAPSVSAQVCQPASSWTPVWLSCATTNYGPESFYEQGALLLAVKPNEDGGIRTNLKGRINFPTLGSGPGHIITLSDSNFQKTIATANNRPTNDANDAFIGYDQGDGNPAHVGISLGAPKSLSSYIGNVGDGSNWKERLTAAQKDFAVPVVIKGGNTFTLGAGSPLSQMKIYKTNGVPAATVPGQSCVDVIGTLNGLSISDEVTSVRPPSKLGNLSLNAYVSAANSIALHFCNPGTSKAKSPPGVYSFLAVH